MSERGYVTTTRISAAIGLLCCLTLVSAGCTDDAGDPTSTTSTIATSTTTTTAASTTTPTTTTATDEPGALFGADGQALDPDPLAIRQRAVTVNLDVLLRSNGKAHDLNRVVLNLFPDTTYTGVIIQRDEMGNGYTWVGFLEGFEVSALTMVWTGSAFAANFASPMGVYEVDSAGGGTYRIVEINQEAFPGEG